MKIAIVHDLLIYPGGAEKVVETLLKIYPQADIFTSIFLKKFYKNSIISKHKVYTSYINDLSIFLSYIPKGLSFYRFFFFEFPKIFETFDLRDYDLIISSHSVAAHGVVTYPGQLHISYTHTPIRAMWTSFTTYLKKFPFWYKNKPFLLAYWALNQFNKYRIWDYVAAQRPDYFFANSTEVKNRILKYYKRTEVSIIHPPVAVKKIHDKTQNIKKENSFYFAISRLQEYKRFDILVKAFKKLPDKKLIIAGTGPELNKLKRLAFGTKNIKFLGYISNKDKMLLYKKAKALLFPAYEDFGIVPVEAQAAGTPVIAFGKGGALDSIIPQKTGLFFYEQSPRAVIKAINEFEKISFDPDKIYRHALKFSEDNFIKKFTTKVNSLLKEKQNS